MASKIRADIAESLTGGPIALTKQHAAKAWANYTSVTTTTLNAGFNISSLTDNGTGDTSVDLTSAMSATSFTNPCSSGDWVMATTPASKTTSRVRTNQFVTTTGGSSDRADASVAMFGTLA